MSADRAGRVAIFGVALLWTYFAVVLLYHDSVIGVWLRTPVWAVMLAASYVLISLALRWMARRFGISGSRANDVAALSISLLFSLLTADAVYAVYQNGHAPAPRSEELEYERMSDPHLWHGELLPRSYFPTDRNFYVYKPHVRMEATTYGEFYEAPMLASPTLRDSVLERRHLVYDIDRHGFREQTPLPEARIFVLGDSFVFGYATEESKTWHEVLERSLDLPIYSLGLSSTGPRTELMALEYLLESNPDSVQIDRLLWMIFEGNDLENSYDMSRTEPPGSERGVRDLLQGTLIDVIASVPSFVKNQSVIYGLRTHRITLGRGARGRVSGGQYEIDGIELAYPLYHSPRWGYRLFNPFDVARATRPRSYVLGHPNRAALDRTFEDMRALANANGFHVTVLVAPSAARVYGADFDEFPSLSEAPHFIEYVMDLSQRMGFDSLNLLEAMVPYVEHELLFYRDDHHWNVRGNAVVAEVIRREVAF